jgi:paraquat-inducible protein A
MMAQNEPLTCHFCGKEHLMVRLAPGETARCTRCDAVLAKGRHGGDVPLVLCVTGLVLSLPGCFLPFISAGKFGAERVSTLLTGVGALWDNGMRALAILVLLCGALLPIFLLGTLAILQAPPRLFGWVASPAILAHAARTLELGAIPEVQVLAVLVALMKLGSQVNVKIGPGFWFYCCMSICLLLAQRSFDYGAFVVRKPGPDKATPA